MTLHDTETVKLRDLGAQFYLQETDEGTNRAEACLVRLQELNAAVSVSASSVELSEAFLKPFKVGLSCLKRLRQGVFTLVGMMSIHKHDFMDSL